MFSLKGRCKHFLIHSFQRHADIKHFFLIFVGIFLSSLFFIYHTVHGSAITNFQMSILPQPLSVIMVDEAYNPVTNPHVDFAEIPYSTSCRQVISRLAASDQQLYIRNFDAANSGWTVTISPENPTDLWTNDIYQFDFNDPTGGGCIDGNDSDAFAGSLEIYTESTTLDSWLCSSCTANSVHQNPGWIFDEFGGINTVTIAYATAGSDNRGDWKISDTFIRQTIPASQPAVGDYELPLLLSITAN